MRLPRAGSLPARGPRPALRIASVSRAIVRLGRGRLRRHLIIERCGPFDPPLTEDRASHCSANAFSRVDLAARAREGAVRFVFTMLLPWIRIRPRHVADLLGLGPRFARSFLDLAVHRVPTRSDRRSRSDDVTRSDDPGGLGRLPLSDLSSGFLPQGRPARWLGLPGTRGCGPAATPVHSTDVCCSRMLFSKTRPQVSANAASSFPTRCGSARFHAEPAHFGEPTDPAGALSPPAADLPASL
jgi:hypothetical protein